MGRVSLKNLFCCLFGLIVVYVIFYCKFNSLPERDELEQSPAVSEDILCVLNREVNKNIGIKSTSYTKKIKCKTDQTEVYVPFSFINHYYEARGDFVFKDGKKEFEISHSYSKVVIPTSKYKTSGQFMNFKTFNVEARSRVLCMSAKTGVPITTQWDAAGYYYATQIAQYSLAHYSNYIANSKKPKDSVIMEDGDTKINLEKDFQKRIFDEESGSYVIKFKNNFDIDVNSNHSMVSLDLKNFEDTIIQILLEDKKKKYILRYLPVDEFLSFVDGEVVFGYGRDVGEWVRITRDVKNDLDKMLSFLKKKKDSHSKIEIRKLQFIGHGQVTNISLSNSEHLRMFMHGANWFIKNQDPTTGGWPTPIVFNKDRKKYPKAAEIKPGWFGAMCQGQAISVLVRAFISTRDERYLTAAEDAVALFNISSRDGGVKAVFMDRYVWYEEYPTSPPSFILNGFMYSLLGLYDLQSVSVKLHAHVSQLFKAGLESLAAMLPLYDSGHATFYDLRHFTMKTAPKGARWDYHATHINQLLQIHTIASNYTIFKETAERWRGYMVNIKSPHN